MNKIYPYAGFWKRAIAFIIDSFVLSIPTGILMAVIWVAPILSIIRMTSANVEPSPDMMMGLVARYFISMALTWLVAIVGGWLYFALMESSKRQATLGKMALGIKVANKNGERITFARATGRYFGKMVSGMTLYFGFYMAGFTQKRQALHDLMADTYVVDKNCQPGPELPALPFSKGFCITSIVVAVAPIVLYIVMFALMMIAGISAGMEDFRQNAQHTNTAAQFQLLEVETEDGQEVPFQVLDEQQAREDSARNALILQAGRELIRLKYNTVDTALPFTKNNITYNQTPQGYTATWNDSPTDQYVLLQTPEDPFACWLNVPPNFDVRFSTAKLCK